MKVDIWMPLYIADYLADTQRLTTEQHGAYLLLIMDYWKSGPPPDDPAVLAQITRLSPDAWSIAQASIKHYFEVEDGKWFHRRIDREIAAAKDKKEVMTNRAKQAAERRWANRDSNAMNANSNAISNASSTPQAMLEQCPSPSPSPVVKTDDAKASLSGRVPDCPHQAIVDLWHETLPECPTIVKWTDTRARLLKGRWREVCVDRDLKTTEEGLEFFRKLFTYIKSSPFLMGKTVSRDGRPFECELEWVINPNNFVKIIEGKYHAQKTR